MCVCVCTRVCNPFENPKIKLKHFLASFVRLREIFFRHLFIVLSRIVCWLDVAFVGLVWLRVVLFNLSWTQFFLLLLPLLLLLRSNSSRVSEYSATIIASATQNFSYEKTYDDLRRKFEGYAVNNSWNVFHFRAHCTSEWASVCNFFFYYYFFSQFGQSVCVCWGSVLR